MQRGAVGYNPSVNAQDPNNTIDTRLLIVILILAFIVCALIYNALT